ncbi:MAG: hypothetical protein ACRCZJ_03350 [Erysipelotrichaceae bacterium]
MKKLLLVLLTIAVLLFGGWYLTGLHPEWYFHMYAKVAQKIDLQWALNKYLPEEQLTLYQSIEGETTKTILDKLQDFDYTITSTTISGSEAIIGVTLESYELGTALAAWGLKSIPQYLILSLQQADRATIDSTLAALLQEQLAPLAKDNNNELKFYLYKENGLWLIDVEEPRNLIAMGALLGDVTIFLQTWELIEAQQ